MATVVASAATSSLPPATIFAASSVPLSITALLVPLSITALLVFSTTPTASAPVTCTALAPVFVGWVGVCALVPGICSHSQENFKSPVAPFGTVKK